MEDNKKYWYWMAQLCGWGFYFLIVILNTYNNGTLDALSISIISLLFISTIGFTHLIRFFVIRSNWLNISFWQLLPRAFALCFVAGSIMLGYQLIIDQAIFYFDDGHEIEPLAFLNVFIGVMTWSILFLLWCTAYFTFHFFQKSRIEEIKNLQLEATRNEIELNNLKSQLNPHFMFNALNSIRALIDENPSHAKLAVTKLSNTLRNSLKMGKNNLVPIKEELELITNYSNIEKIRFEERLEIDFQIQNKIEEFYIPPLIIQTLVENAIKHGISKRVKGGKVLVQINTENENLIIQVTNSGILKPNTNTTSGIGIANTIKRIDLTYGDQGSFELYDNKKSEETYAKITISNYQKFNENNEEIK